jgi:hypothetical protein
MKKIANLEVACSSEPDLLQVSQDLRVYLTEKERGFI